MITNQASTESVLLGEVTRVSGNALISRHNGDSQPLRTGDAVGPGDRILSQAGSQVEVNFPGTARQAGNTLRLGDGAQAAISLDRSPGQDGTVRITRIDDPQRGLAELETSDLALPQAAFIEGEEPTVMSGLFGLGAGAGLAGLGGAALLPAAGVLGFAGLVESSGNGEGNTGGDNPPASIADDAGGLVQTIENLSQNLDDLTAPIPVVGDVVNLVTDVVAGNSGNASLLPPLIGGATALVLTVNDQIQAATEGIPVVGQLTGVLDAILQGDNNGGLSGLISGLGEGVSQAAEGTPLEVLAQALDQPLDLLSGGLTQVADTFSGLGEGTPVAPLSNLVGDLLGTSDAPGSSISSLSGLLNENLGAGLLPDLGRILG